MASFNKFTCVGRLTRDPELRALSNGKNVTKFSVAVDRRGGSRENHETDFFDITAWERLAETCNTYLKKGMLVLVEGRIQIRLYEGSDGVKRKAVDVIANDMQMLERPANGNGRSAGEERPTASRSSAPADSFDEDDLPF